MARSRSSERATKESHHSDADTVLLVPAAAVTGMEVDVAAPPLAMGGGGLRNPSCGEEAGEWTERIR